MSNGATVTVADILELRADGLAEEEIWSLLCQAVQTLQDLFLSGEPMHKEIVPLITPNTLGISSKGKVVITFVNKISNHQENYLAPEYRKRGKIDLTNLDLEKMWVFTLGRTLLLALKAGASRESTNVLKFMTASDPICRASLMSLLNIISEHFKINLPSKPFSHLVIEMYKEVFGNPPQCLFSVKAFNLNKVSAEKIPKIEPSGVFHCKFSNLAEKPCLRIRTGEEITELSKKVETQNKKIDCAFRRNPVQRAPSRLYKGPAVTEPGRPLLPSHCVGPEFVVRAMRPPKVVHVGDVKASHRKSLIVILLTGQKVRITCDPHTITCHKLFEVLVDTEEIEDDFLFGLASLIKGDFVFLPSETKLHKVSPSGWKDGKLGSEPSSCNFFLYLRVKFFLPSLHELRNHKTKHLMYLQLRRSLLEQQIKCQPRELLALGGLALQAEFGSFDEEVHGLCSYFLLEHYFPEEIIDDRLKLETRLQELHKSKRGLDPSLAEEIFVTQVQKLPEYGSHHHTATWERKSLNIPMWVTVSPQGVYLYEKKNYVLDRRVHEAFPWKNIQRFSFRENYFCLRPHDSFGQKVPYYKLRMESKKSFFLFRLASFHHRFFLKLRIELSPLHSLSQEFGIGSRKSAKTIFYLEKNKSLSELESGIEVKNNKISAPGEDSDKGQNKENDNPPDYKAEKRAGVKMGISALNLSNSERFSFSNVSISSQDAFVIDSSIKSSDQRFSYDCYESIPSNLAREWDEISCVEERILKKVRLKKDKYGSYGLEVREGSSGGLYIENILKRNEGDDIGSIQKGDQLLSANGICLLNLNYSEALSVLRTTGNQIELLVSQSCNKGTFQQPIEHEYLKSIRYETANETENI